MIRVITLPIREIVDSDARIIDTFRSAWNLSTALANWAQLELICRDVRREPAMEAMPKYDRSAMFGTHPARFNRAAKGDKVATKVGDPKVGDLYGLFNRECGIRGEFTGCAASARDILTTVEKTWTGHKDFGRFAVLWKGSASGATYRWPYPWPVPSEKGWTLRLWRNEEGRPVASLLLPGGRVAVRLGDGANYKRQLKRFDWLLANIDKLKQGKVTARYDFINGRRKLMGADLRIVGDFPNAEKIEGVDAILTTGKESLLSLVVDGDDGNPFVYNADHLKGIIHCHDRWRHRFARDLKFEKRWPAEKRRRTVYGATAQARIDRCINRLDSERKQMATMMVGYCRRNGVAKLHYDDREHGFLPRFDWTALRTALSCKCESEGIEFQHIAGVEDGE